MKRKLFFTLVVWTVSLLGAIGAWADNYRLHIENFSIEAGATKTVSVLLDNGTKGFTGFETCIYLPDGLTLVETFDEDEEMNMAFYLNADRKKSKHDMMYAKQSDGSYKLLAGGNGVQTYGGTSGTELFHFSVTAAPDFSGTATIRIAKTLFTDVNLDGFDFPDETCTVTGPAPVDPDEPAYRLYIEDFSIEAGATKTVSVLLDNGTKGFTGFETCIYLSEGLTLVETFDEDEEMNMAFYLNADRKKSKHDMMYAKQSDGSYKLLAGGNGVQTYGGTSGTELFHFSVTAAPDFSGTATIRIAKTLFTDVNLDGFDFPDETCTVTGPAPVDPDEPAYRLHIEDFSIEAGATKTVSVLLDNGTKGFTGFETSIYLPEGLTLVETFDEDEEMNMAFYLNADRKKSKHDMMYAKQSDGSYKLLAGGNGVQTYGGTSGTELFHFSVTAAPDFSGTATIRIAKTLFTDVNLDGFDFPDETCTVTVNRVVVEYTITATSANTTMGTVTGGGTYTHGATATLTATPKTGYEFVQWSDGTTANPYTITATANKSVTAQFQVAAMLGDVNLDTKITAADMVGAVNFILNTNTTGLSRAAADVNRDGDITVADATGIVNLALGLPLTASSNQRRVLAADSEVRLTIDAFRLAPGADEFVPVVLCAEADEFTALQFDVLLPEGIRLTDVLCDDDHIAAFAQQADGMMRIVVLSPDNVPFAGNGLAALTLQLAADADAAPGTIAVDAIEVARPDMSRVAPAAFSAAFGFAGPTGIESVESTDNSPLYDIQGRRTIGAGHGIYVIQGRKVVK